MNIELILGRKEKKYSSFLYKNLHFECLITQLKYPFHITKKYKGYTQNSIEFLMLVSTCQPSFGIIKICYFPKEPCDDPWQFNTSCISFVTQQSNHFPAICFSINLGGHMIIKIYLIIRLGEIYITQLKILITAEWRKLVSRNSESWLENLYGWKNRQSNASWTNISY